MGLYWETENEWVGQILVSVSLYPLQMPHSYLGVGFKPVSALRSMSLDMIVWSHFVKKGRLVGLFQHCIRRLIVLLPPNEFLHSSPESPLTIQARETSASEGINYYQGIYESTTFFYMPQSWDMGQILLLPLRRRACRGLFGHQKNSRASAGFYTANSGTRSQHANH